MMNKKKLKTTIFITALFLYILNPNLVLPEISVLNSLIHEREARAGDTYQNIIYIKNMGENSAKIKIYQRDYLLLKNGKREYLEPGKLAQSNAAWINFNINQLIIPPETVAEVKCNVKVPAKRNMSGTYWSMIVAEDISENSTEKSTQENSYTELTNPMDNRSGIQIITHIGKPETGTLKLLNVDFLEKNSKSILRINIINSGKWLLNPLVWVDLYNNKDGHVGRFLGKRLRSYPGSSTEYWISLNRVPKGEYKALVVCQNISINNSEELSESVSLLKCIARLDVPESQQQDFETAIAYNNEGNITNSAPVSDNKPVFDVFDTDLFEVAPELSIQNEPLVEDYPKKTPAANNHEQDGFKAEEKRETNVVAKVVEETSASPPSSNDFHYYTVQSGDCLTKIAYHYYGNEKKFTKILSANRENILDPNIIYPGQKLLIPAEQKHEEIYVVQSGDCLSKIAVQFYGDAMKYPKIFHANRRIIKDANLIYPGQRLLIPSVSDNENDFYTVKAGDSLSKIAEMLIGHNQKYIELFEANRETIKNPNLLFPGQRLKIPSKHSLNTIVKNE